MNWIFSRLTGRTFGGRFAIRLLPKFRPTVAHGGESWRIEPQKMEDRHAKMKKGDRKAASLGSVQHTAKARGEWVSLYGELSSAVHPEGLLDAISQLPLTADLATFLVLPRFQHAISLSLFKVLITEVAWMSEEVFALQIEYGTEELTREHHHLDGVVSNG